tara:strand:- start:281 stop:1414 length:1134 start_codon:yes stop_codon:yes gene_type:complete
MAGGTVKSVSVVYQAFTDKFEKALDRTSGKMSGFVKKAAGIAIGFVAARATLGRFTKAMADLDKLGKLSDSLEIDPNTLRGLDLAATQTGTSFELITKGIQRMVQTIGEARSGMSTGTLALKELGMTVEDFEGLNAEQQFMKMADAIAAIEDPAQKAAAANKLFGRSGKDLLNILNQGSKGMKEFIKEAERVGGPISREDIRQVEMANDAMDKMGRTFDSIFQQLAIQLAPTIEKMADGLQEFFTISESIGTVWRNTEGWVQKVADAIHGITDDIKEQKPGTFFKEALEKADKAISKTSAGGSFSGAVQPTRGFASSAAFQSSKAFDILNPAKPNSIAGKNAAANETTAKNTSAMKERLAKLVNNRNKATVTVIPGG